MWIIWLLAIALAADPAEGWTQDVTSAWDAGRAFPRVAATLPRADLALAYQVQHRVVAPRIEREGIAAFKAGLTSKAAQATLGADGPVWGVIPGGGARHTGAVLGLSGLGAPMVEAEIALRLGATITTAPEDIASLKAMVDAVVPVLELPDLGFGPGGLPDVRDLVATGVGAAQLVAGPPTPTVGLDLAAMSVSLERDGIEIASGLGAEALGDPWAAALWLVQAAVADGYEVPAGTLLLTGAIGGMHPVGPGSYIATFPGVGEVRLHAR